MPPLSSVSRLQLTQLDARPDAAAIQQLTDAGLRAMLMANGIPRANTDRRGDFARHLIDYLAGDPSRQLEFPPSIALQRDLQKQAERSPAEAQEMEGKGGEAGGSWAPAEAQAPSGLPCGHPTATRVRPGPALPPRAPEVALAVETNLPPGGAKFNGWKRGEDSWGGGTPRPRPTTHPPGWSCR